MGLLHFLRYERTEKPNYTIAAPHVKQPILLISCRNEKTVRSHLLHRAQSIHLTHPLPSFGSMKAVVRVRHFKNALADLKRAGEAKKNGFEGRQVKSFLKLCIIEGVVVLCATNLLVLSFSTKREANTQCAPIR